MLGNGGLAGQRVTAGTGCYPLESGEHPPHPQPQACCFCPELRVQLGERRWQEATPPHPQLALPRARGEEQGEGVRMGWTEVEGIGRKVLCHEGILCVGC